MTDQLDRFETNCDKAQTFVEWAICNLEEGWPEGSAEHDISLEAREILENASQAITRALNLMRQDDAEDAP